MDNETTSCHLVPCLLQPNHDDELMGCGAQDVSGTVMDHLHFCMDEAPGRIIFPQVKPPPQAAGTQAYLVVQVQQSMLETMVLPSIDMG